MCDGYVALLQGLHTALETLSDALIYLYIFNPGPFNPGLALHP